MPGSQLPFTLDDFSRAAKIIAEHFQPTPQYSWPLLEQETGISIMVKHENHTPLGAFKARGGLVHITNLKQQNPDLKGIISATRGNHGQSLANAARACGIPCTIVVPHGNSLEKNAAIKALGASLIESGQNFDEAKKAAIERARQYELHFVSSFHLDLVLGVGTYGIELMKAAPDLDAIYVPIGLGSGICGLMTARDALGHKAKIIGVVSEDAPAYALSFEQNKPVNAPASTFADGIAVGVPDPGAVDMIVKGTERVIRVSNDSIAGAVRMLYRTTHNLAEGAGAAALAGLLQEKKLMSDKKVAVILTGQNIDTADMATILQGNTPLP
ncbi:MAG: threonine dehydratase [Cohaesibacteraceae bacterium]|nr:threonine dehydratase [Cohaesibacteraceae bacterium]